MATEGEQFGALKAAASRARVILAQEGLAAAMGIFGGEGTNVLILGGGDVEWG